MWIFRLILLCLLIISPLASATNQTLIFGSSMVTMKGTIITLKFPGPPNYESIAKGDKPESGAYLILDNPVDIDSQDKVNEPRKNVKLVQLIVMNHDDWKYLKQGNYVSITGTLSSSITGHHHARALIDVNKVSVISKKKISSSELNNLTKEDKDFVKLNNLNSQGN